VTAPPATILVVDDEPHNRKLLETLLKPEGYVTFTADSGREALILIAQQPPDLILLDVMMPEMSGFEVARILKADPATAHIPIIIVTASVDRSSRITGLDSGAEDFLMKPVDRAELWLRVRNLLRLKALSDFQKSHNGMLEQEVQARTASLRESERRFSDLLANVELISIMLDREARITYCNDYFLRLTGWRREEVIGRNWFEAFMPVVLGDMKPVFEQLLANAAEARHRDNEIFTRTGERRLIRWNNSVLRSSGGEVIGSASIGEDITEQRQATALLAQSQERLALATESAKIGIWDFDVATNKLVWNSQMYELYGIRDDDFSGAFDAWQKGLHPDDRARAEADFSGALTGSNEFHPEFRVVWPNGEVHDIQAHAVVTRVGEGPGTRVTGVNWDITEDKRAELKIKRLNRVYAVLSDINALIVRVSNRDELFRDACQIAIQEGGFVMSLIALVDAETKKIVPVASAGVNEELLAAISAVLTSKQAASSTMVARAIMTKATVVSNNSQIDPQILFAKRYADAGVHSMAVLPLIVADEAVGVFALYSREINFFRDDELKLLTELAGDVAFAIDHIDKQERLDYLAYYDALTGLPNRTLFQETLKKTLAQASDSGWQVALICIDLDLFKNVNDTLGHAIGDELLRQFGARLVQCVRTGDTVGRMGGDEFAVVLLMPEGRDAAVFAAHKIRDSLRERFELSGHQVTLTASIGITLHPDDASDTETLMRFGDTAMYQAKQAGRDTFRFFTAQMNVEVLARLELETALRKAIANEEFVLHYQPKIQLGSGRIDGFEALLRWQRPGHGLVGPRHFVRALEETGLIVRVGSWVVAKVCRQMALWAESGIGLVQVSVNVSGRQFIEGDLEGDVIKALNENNIASDQLELELTESSLMANTERTIEILHNLKKRGVQISIDDFGTGYSSLAYLRRFPIDKLKIDIAFIRDLTSNPDAASIVLAIIRMAHSLKMEVIAEGVETAAQLAYLRRHHCDHIQGYYFSPPAALLEVEQMLREGKRLPALTSSANATSNTLLLVDDEPDVLAALKRALRDDGYNILSATSAEQGFEQLALHSVQIILCDELMPDMNGTAFLDRVKDMYPDTLRIILSGCADLRSIVDAINRGSVYRYYTKPWDNKELRANLRAAFRQYWLLRGDSDDSNGGHSNGDVSAAAESPTEANPTRPMFGAR
jgi:diguanylate cyclase (GGDEF)-like protein/PAS domain S-box-containing protein